MRTEPITDHVHEYEMRGIWRTGKCSRCGGRVNRHLSWGESIAAAVGGDPLEYVDLR